MRVVDFPLDVPSEDGPRRLRAAYFGVPGARPKVYIQAGLHADEIPGMLVAHYLRELLTDLESKGLLTGEIVLVPVANPIGLEQTLHHQLLGRYDLRSGENFNRCYPDFLDAVWQRIGESLGKDVTENVLKIRGALNDAIDQWTPGSEVQSLRKTLMRLAADADLVLDLHCDAESVMHFYTESPCWPKLKPLADYLRCRVVLLSRQAPGQSFDESLSGVWWRLADRLGTPQSPEVIAQACLSATIELRGQADVSDQQASQDALQILQFLMRFGAVQGIPEDVPEALCQATPLAGSHTLVAPSAGVVVFRADLGADVGKGQTVVRLVDPKDGVVTPVCSEVSGLFYARTRERYVQAGAELAKVAGRVAFRTGELLGA